YGKTVDNVIRLEVATYDGERFWAGPTSDAEYERILAAGGRRAEIYRQLRNLRDRHAEQIRARFPRIPRRVSGYNLDSLLPENHFDLARALVGSESTLVTVLRAEVRLVDNPRYRAMAVLGYPDIFAAADAVPRVNEHDPLAVEGIDDKLISFEKTKHLNSEALDLLPEGAGWLLVQFVGDSQQQADDRAQALVEELERTEHAPAVKFYDDATHEDEMWDVRESGLGATARVPGLPDTWEGWEDSAVAPDHLGAYLRDLRALMTEFDYQAASLYGHFGDACVHTRIPFDLASAGGVRRYREFVELASDLVLRHHGSFSGEHGDGQSRAELWPKMFGQELVRAFGEFKAIFDPGDRMNPGKLAAPFRLDENLRLGADFAPWDPPTEFGYPDDGASFSRAVLRCVGVGKCRRDSGGVMCPSYRATREEEHSTRGRARLLFEMLRGEVITDGWRSEAVRDSLDLCLACKGCKNDCPVNVDMATYKAEFMSHHYAGRIRPMSHYSMGWIPVWAALASTAPGLVNALTHAPGLSTLVKRLGGIAPERPVPVFAPQRFTDWFADRGPRGTGERGDVVLWPDTFSNNLHPSVGRAAVEVLEAAGFRVRVPPKAVCCGLTWISTGQLGIARRVARHTLAVLRGPLRRGVPMVGLEPSCTAVFRSDLPELMPHDLDVGRLRDQTFTLSELLNDRAADWSPPRIDAPAVVQPHCHQHAVLGMDPDTELMRRFGLEPRLLDAGCCGLAGNFGFERGHFSVSMRSAELGLLPAVRGADRRAFVLADGFSCRTQIEHAGTGRQAVHLAEALALALRGGRPGEHPERLAAQRPAPPQRARWSGDLGGAAIRAGRPDGSTPG
ncbi:MAG TPA: FAD-linked oxidase C-terminal domain-containing protein, partial [Mycobacteriales bacterium]|nr:FAD-linked oxidase C-terminal domain-containing protein [Mycobacteriales bacterium]